MAQAVWCITARNSSNCPEEIVCPWPLDRNLAQVRRHRSLASRLSPLSALLPGRRRARIRRSKGRNGCEMGVKKFLGAASGPPSRRHKGGRRSETASRSYHRIHQSLKLKGSGAEQVSKADSRMRACEQYTSSPPCIVTFAASFNSTHPPQHALATLIYCKNPQRRVPSPAAQPHHQTQRPTPHPARRAP